MRNAVLFVALGLVALAGHSAAGRPADPVAAYPENYTVLFENEKVRVLDFRLRSGASEKAHSHPEHVAVFLADFNIRFTLPDGGTALREAKAGQTAYSGLVTHASENIGPTDAHGILVELKDAGSRASGAEGRPHRGEAP